MNRKDSFDFEEFEKVIKKLPKVEDHRSKEVIFQNIKKQIHSEPKKKDKKWIVPTIASTAAILLLVALFPMMFGNDHEEAIHGTEEAEVSEMFAIEVEEAKETAETGHNRYISALVEETLLENQRIVTVPFVDEQARFIVPVSFIVRDDGMLLNQITTIVEEYDPANVGLNNSPLQGVTMKEISDITVEVNLSEVPVGSANEIMLVEAIKMALSSLPYSFANILVNGQEGVDIGQFGPQDHLEVNGFSTGYYFYESPNGMQLLVKGTKEKTVNFEGLLQRMKGNEGVIGFQPVIPEKVVIESVDEEKEGITTVTFRKDMDLSAVPNAMMMIDAILLAARDSGIKEVRFENVGVEQLGPYDFNQPISTKIYPNGVTYR